MLARLFETGEKVKLDIKVLWLFCKEDFVPALSCRPSSCLTMLQDLLIYIEYLQMSRNAFNTVWFVYLCVNFLESFIQGFKIHVLVCISIFVSFLPDVLLPMKECTGERFTLYRPTGYHVRGYQCKDCLYILYLQSLLLEVGFGWQSTCPRSCAFSIGNFLFLLLHPTRNVIEDLKDGLNTGISR